MFKLLKLEMGDPKLAKQFREKLILENSKRVLIIMAFITASQLIFLLLEASGVLQWALSVFLYRAIVIFICALFTFLIYIYRRKELTKKVIRDLSIITVTLNVVISLLGIYFTIYMFKIGGSSFSSLLLAAYLLSLSYIRKPSFYTVVCLSVFTILSVFIILRFGNTSLLFISEYLITLVFIILLCVGSYLNYQRHWSLFMQERKIREISEELKYISQTDEATGIYNRRKAIDELENQVALSKRYGTVFSIALLDIDNFKMINDNHGHITGDYVLKSFSDFLKINLRETDILGRLGGDEFIIIIPQCDAQSAYKFVERIREKIENHSFDNNAYMTFSAGVCSHVPGQTVSDIINCADHALYASKDRGRNRVSLFEADM